LAYQFRKFDLKMCMDMLSPRLTSLANAQQAQEDEMEDGQIGGTSNDLTRV
jgi:hypothetical protein